MKKRSKIKRATKSNSSVINEDSKHFAMFMVILFLFLIIILAGVILKGRYINEKASASVRGNSFSVSDLDKDPCKGSGPIEYLFCE